MAELHPAFNLSKALRLYESYKAKKRESDFAISRLEDRDNKWQATLKWQEVLSPMHRDLMAACDPLTAWIDESQRKCSVRTICATDILNEIFSLEKELECSKKAMVGVIAWVDPNASNFPKAYKYTPESTQFRLERRPSGWFVTGVVREKTKDANHHFTVTLTDAAKAEIIERYEHW